MVKPEGGSLLHMVGPEVGRLRLTRSIVEPEGKRSFITGRLLQEVVYYR